MPTTYNLNSVKGSYVFNAFGFIDPNNWLNGTPNPPIPGFYSSDARIYHDGNGNWHLKGKTKYCTGEVRDDDIQGTYTVDQNGGVTYTHLGIAGVYSLLVKNGEEARGMSLIPGITNTIMAIKE